MTSPVNEFLKTTEVLKRFLNSNDVMLDKVQEEFVKTYQENSMNVYKENPYILCTEFELPFYYFRIQEGINDFSKSRITVPTFDMHLNETYAAILDILRANESLGNSYMLLHDIYTKLRKFFPYTTEERIKAYLNYFSDSFYFEDNKVAILSTARNELYIKRRVLELLSRDTNTTMGFSCVNSDLLCEEQNDAVRSSMTSDLFILTGGPGSGKTTTIRTILANYKENYPNRTVALVAPIGKAARRLTESVEGYDVARTIDSLVFSHQIRNEKEEIDLCIVDESSMLKIDVFSDFLRYINPKKIILVGDIDQLPSIGAGNILHDLINMGVKTSRLLINHRNGDVILDNSRKVNKKQTNLVFNNNFKFIEALGGDIDEIASSLRENDEDIILTPYRYESIKINTLIHNRIFPGSYYKYEIGDKVMFLHNNRQKHYVNGDVGSIVRFEENDMVIALDNDTLNEIYLNEKDCSDIIHAYSMTVHKSQGSEYRNVYITIPKGCSNIFSRKLLYTAITRAKEKVIFIGQKEELKKLITTSNENNRITFLSEEAIITEEYVNVA